MNIPKEEDPFWEPAEDVLIGTANAFLQSLGFNLDFDGKITVTDFKVRVQMTCLTVALLRFKLGWETTDTVSHNNITSR